MPRAPISNRILLRDQVASLQINSTLNKVVSNGNCGVVGSSAFSMGGWWKPKDLQLGVAYNWLLSLGTTVANKAWTLGATSSGFLELGSFGIDLPSTIQPNLNQWGHLVGVFAGGANGNVKVYWNGVLIKNIACGFTPNLDDGVLTVAQFASSSASLGLIDECFLYNNVAITQQQVMDIYNNGIYAPGVSILYRFNEGTGTVATDSSGNSNNGTITNPLWSTDVAIKPRTAVSGRVPAVGRQLIT